MSGKILCIFRKQPFTNTWAFGQLGYTLRWFINHVNQTAFSTYVAIGDSLTEGLGDETFKQNRVHNGWADRLAHLLAEDARRVHTRFEFANLAVRGSKTRTILGPQLDAALALKPDLLTIMTGANDILGGKRDYARVEELLEFALQRIGETDTRVVLANLASPGHIAVARTLRSRTKRMSQLINRVAAKHGIAVIDLQGMAEFGRLDHWCEDMAHFSALGHSLIANRAAQLLGSAHRYTDGVAGDENLGGKRKPIQVVSWLKRDVWPFVLRRLQGKTSGDGLVAKLPVLTSFYAPAAYAEAIRSEMATKTALQSSR